MKAKQLTIFDDIQAARYLSDCGILTQHVAKCLDLPEIEDEKLRERAEVAMNCLKLHFGREGFKLNDLEQMITAITNRHPNLPVSIEMRKNCCGVIKIGKYDLKYSGERELLKVVDKALSPYEIVDCSDKSICHNKITGVTIVLVRRKDPGLNISFKKWSLLKQTRPEQYGDFFDFV